MIKKVHLIGYDFSMKKYTSLVLIVFLSIALTSCDWLPYYEGSKAYEDGSVYIGEFRFGKKDGRGVMTFAGGDVYTGEFKDDKRHGQGTLTVPNGANYVGEWKNGKPTGQGTYTHPDGTTHVGEWPVIKKKDNFDPTKIAELIDLAEDTKPIKNVKDEEYESLESTDSLINKLTLSQEDAIRSQFIKCWTPPSGMVFDETMIVSIKINLKPDGYLMKPPEVVDHQRMNSPGQNYYKILAESALRAVRICNPIKTPASMQDRYDDWKVIQLNFDPREVLRN